MQVVTRPTGLLTLNLDHREQQGPHPKKFGTLTVHAEECVGSKTMVEMVFRCVDLENKDLFSKSVNFCLLLLRNIYRKQRIVLMLNCLQFRILSYLYRR